MSKAEERIVYYRVHSSEKLLSVWLHPDACEASPPALGQQPSTTSMRAAIHSICIQDTHTVRALYFPPGACSVDAVAANARLL